MVYTGEYKAKSSLSNGRLPTPGAPGELALDEQKSTCCFVSDPPHSAASGCGGFSVLLREISNFKGSCPKKRWY